MSPARQRLEDVIGAAVVCAAILAAYVLVAVIGVA